jgi:hypothetical protein
VDKKSIKKYKKRKLLKKTSPEDKQQKRLIITNLDATSTSETMRSSTAIRLAIP